MLTEGPPKRRITLKEEHKTTKQTIVVEIKNDRRNLDHSGRNSEERIENDHSGLCGLKRV